MLTAAFGEGACLFVALASLGTLGHAITATPALYLLIKTNKMVILFAHLVVFKAEKFN